MLLGIAQRRFGGRLLLPGAGAQVVAAQHQRSGWKPLPPASRLDEGGEVRRRHAGVAAVLVDLVAGRLDEQGRVVGCRGGGSDASSTWRWAEQTE